MLSSLIGHFFRIINALTILYHKANFLGLCRNDTPIVKK
jgi:hypothetical protein